MTFRKSHDDDITSLEKKKEERERERENWNKKKKRVKRANCLSLGCARLLREQTSVTFKRISSPEEKKGDYF
jgi:hypothetical protein